MRQLNLPKKYTTVTRIWVSFALILLAALFAFMPLLRIDLSDNQLATSVENSLNWVGEQLGEDDLNIDIPEKVDVSTVKVFKSLFMFGKFVETAMSASNGAEADEIYESLQKLHKEINSPEGQEALVMMLALVAQSVDIEGILPQTSDAWAPTESDYSGEDLELALGELYKKGGFSRDTLNNYLEKQYALFLVDKSAYLQSIGCEDSIDNFPDIPAVNVFSHLRTLTCAYMGYYMNASTPVSYDYITTYIETYQNYGSWNIYESAMNGLTDFCNYYSPVLFEQYMDRFDLDMVFGNQATKMVAVLMKEEILTDAEYQHLMKELADDETSLYYINLDELFEYLDLSDAKLDDAFELLFEAEAYYTVTGATVEAAEQDNTSTIAILKTMVGLLLTLWVVSYIILWPIILVIFVLIALKNAIVSTKNKEENGKIHACMVGSLCFTISSLLLLTLLPDVTWGTGMIVIFVLSLLSLVVNVVASRLRAYNMPDFKYVNLVQAAAALTGVGLIVYTVSVLNTGFLRNFMDTLFPYLTKLSAQLAVYNQEVHFYQSFFDQNMMCSASASSLYMLDLALLAVAAILAFIAIRSITKTVAARLGLIKYKTSASAFPLVAPIVAMIACILPIVASCTNSHVIFTRTTSGVETTTDGSLFVIGDSLGALIGMFIGAVLMLGAAIAFRVLRNKFCADVSDTVAKQIVIGDAPAYGSAEASVEESPVEEAPVEENIEA